MGSENHEPDRADQGSGVTLTLTQLTWEDKLEPSRDPPF